MTHDIDETRALKAIVKDLVEPVLLKWGAKLPLEERREFHLDLNELGVGIVEKSIDEFMKQLRAELPREGERT